jgi:hypothetical protein
MLNILLKTIFKFIYFFILNILILFMMIKKSDFIKIKNYKKMINFIKKFKFKIIIELIKKQKWLFFFKIKILNTMVTKSELITSNYLTYLS